MLTLSLTVGKLHPAVVKALCAEAGPAHPAVSAEDFIDAVTVRVNETIEEGRQASETAYRATEKAGGKSDAKFWKVNLTGSVKGIKLPDSPTGLIARLNTYLEGSREYFLRVEEVKLPSSVADFAKALHAELVKLATATAGAKK